MQKKYYHEEIQTNIENPVKVKAFPVIKEFYPILEHWHSGIEINYMISSEADYVIDGTYHRAKKGDLVLINSGSIHGVVPDLKIQSKEGIQAITVIIPESFFSEYIEGFEFIYFELKSDDHINKIKNVLMNLADIFNNNDNYKNIKLASLTYELIYLLCTYYKKSKDSYVSYPKNITIVKGIIEYIDNNYQKDLTIQEIAQTFSFSREHLSRMFKNYTGITIREYIVKIRLSKAHTALMNTDLNITEVAINNGFTDSRTFINKFKQYYGFTPLQYKKYHK